MISWVILHRNRPFFLQICIDTLRKFGHPSWKIVVVDSGSEKYIVDAIKKLSMDDMYVGRPDETSGNILSGFKACRDSEFIAFTEDDFIYAAQPLRLDQIIRYDLFPDIKFLEVETGWGYNEAVLFMRSNPDINYVNMSNKKTKMSSKRTRQSVVNRVLFQPATTHTNWPHLMRTECVNEITLPQNLSIAEFEYHCQQKVIADFGPPFRLIAGCHSHLGNWMSVNPTKTRIQTKIDEKCMRLAHRFGFSSVLDFRQYLIDLWIKGRFRFDVDEFVKEGTFRSMQSTFERIK